MYILYMYIYICVCVYVISQRLRPRSVDTSTKGFQRFSRRLYLYRNLWSVTEVAIRLRSLRSKSHSFRRQIHVRRHLSLWNAEAKFKTPSPHRWSESGQMPRRRDKKQPHDERKDAEQHHPGAGSRARGIWGAIGFERGPCLRHVVASGMVAIVEASKRFSRFQKCFRDGLAAIRHLFPALG